jgi:formiminotetrahydrofolate cyclodeaminase
MEQVAPFLEELASAAPVPGGGSAAAVAAGMGAALLAMVSNLTLGRKRYADVQERAEGARDEALRLMMRACELAEDDARAYAGVSAALAMPRASDSEKAERRSRIQQALKDAAGPPLETMQVASEIARQSAQLVTFGNRSAITDVGTAALLAHSAFKAARLNVVVNLNSVDDEAWVADLRRRLEAIPDPGPWNEAVQSDIARVLETG